MVLADNVWFWTTPDYVISLRTLVDSKVCHKTYKKETIFSVRKGMKRNVKLIKLDLSKEKFVQNRKLPVENIVNPLSNIQKSDLKMPSHPAISIKTRRAPPK